MMKDAGTAAHGFHSAGHGARMPYPFFFFSCSRDNRNCPVQSCHTAIRHVFHLIGITQSGHRVSRNASWAVVGGIFPFVSACVLAAIIVNSQETQKRCTYRTFYPVHWAMRGRRKKSEYAPHWHCAFGYFVSHSHSFVSGDKVRWERPRHGGYVWLQCTEWSVHNVRCMNFYYINMPAHEQRVCVCARALPQLIFAAWLRKTKLRAINRTCCFTSRKKIIKTKNGNPNRSATFAAQNHPQLKNGGECIHREIHEAKTMSMQMEWKRNARKMKTYFLQMQMETRIGWKRRVRRCLFVFNVDVVTAVTAMVAMAIFVI